MPNHSTTTNFLGVCDDGWQGFEKCVLRHVQEFGHFCVCVSGYACRPCVVLAPHLTYTLVRCSAPAMRAATSLPGCPLAGRCRHPHQAVQRFAFILAQLVPQRGRMQDFALAVQQKAILALSSLKFTIEILFDPLLADHAF